MASTNNGTTSLVYQKPAYLNNNVLVVSKLDKKYKDADLKQYINELAGRHVQLLHVKALNKTVSTWNTLAIELNDEDFKLLSDPNFWHVGIGIKPYVGRRWWHSSQTPRPSREEYNNAIRQSWS